MIDSKSSAAFKRTYLSAILGGLVIAIAIVAAFVIYVLLYGHRYQWELAIPPGFGIGLMLIMCFAGFAALERPILRVFSAIGAVLAIFGMWIFPILIFTEDHSS